MAPVAKRLALVLLLSATAAAGPRAPAAVDPAPPLGAGEIRVRMRPGAGHPRTGADGVAVLRLLDCAAPGQDDAGGARAEQGRPTVARNGSGDALEIPPDGVPPQTEVQIIRPRGRPYRWVMANASSPVQSAQLTIDLRGCAAAEGLRVVLFSRGGWEDVGGQVQGTSITAQLPHLSIYALAGN